MRQMIFGLAALAMVLSVASTASFAKDKKKGSKEEGWVELGSRKVDFKGDHDTIEVGADAGRFSRISFDVEDGDLIMDRVKITFRDGTVHKPDVKHEFKEGARSRAIDLPGDARVIQTVEFFYRSERRREPATIVLYGKQK